jgi:hypothetical protein
MAMALARAASAPERAAGPGQDLCDVYCSGARLRLAGHWNELATESEPAYAAVCDRVMSSGAGRLG